MSAKRNVSARPVRVRQAAYEQIRKLVQRAARDGWKALGVNRTDPPTIAAVIEVAVAQLLARGA